MSKEEIVRELKEMVVSALDLEDVTAADIDPEEPLFEGGLGLDSIDALELGMAARTKFGISFSGDAAENKRIFRSIGTLADYIAGRNQ